MTSPLKTIEGKEVYFSASSANGFRACQRRWWFRKVLGFQEPQGAALIFGIGVHAIFEEFLKTGEVLAPGVVRDGVEITREMVRRATPGFGKLPTGYLIEEWLDRLVLASGDEGTMRAVGKIDMHKPDRLLPTGETRLHIIDHKTSSDPEKWGHTPDTLATDPQGLFYAACKRRAGGTQGDVDFSHHIVAKRGTPRTYMVDATMSWSTIERAWKKAQEIASQMLVVGKGARSVGEQDSVPYNRKSCFSYGQQCPFAAQCNAQGNKGLFSVTSGFDAARKDHHEEPKMSLFEKMRKRTDPGSKEPETRVTPDRVSLGVVSKGQIQEIAEAIGSEEDITLGTIQDHATKGGLNPSHVPNLVAAFLPDELPEESAGLAEQGEDTLLSGQSPEEIIHQLANEDRVAQLLGIKSKDAWSSILPSAEEEILRLAVDSPLAEDWQRAIIQAQLDAIDAPIPWKAEKNARIVQCCEHILLLPPTPGALSLADVRAAIEDAAIYKKLRPATLDQVYTYLGLHVSFQDTQEGLVRVSLWDTAEEPPAEMAAPEAAPPAPAPVIPVVNDRAFFMEGPEPAGDLTVLCVQVIPMGVAVRDLYETGLVRQAIETVQARINGGVHWRVFNDYGDTGPRRVVLETERRLLQGETLPTGWWYIDRSDPLLSADLLAVLRSAGAIAIRGVI
jgi:hypothetical protein